MTIDFDKLEQELQTIRTALQEQVPEHVQVSVDVNFHQAHEVDNVVQEALVSPNYVTRQVDNTCWVTHKHKRVDVTVFYHPEPVSFDPAWWTALGL